MQEVVESAETTKFSDTYCQVLQFYAVQMQELDSGHDEAWASMFTEDVVYTSNRMVGEITGREMLRGEAEHEIKRLVLDGVTRRHLVTDLRVELVDEGAIGTSSCVLIIDTAAGKPVVRAIAMMRDELGQSADSWLVRRRTVEYDGRDPDSF